MNSPDANASAPAMQLYKTQVKRYSHADVTDGIVAYGWTTGAELADILHRSPALTRSSVMETARTLTGQTGIALQLPGSTWST